MHLSDRVADGFLQKADFWSHVNKKPSYSNWDREFEKPEITPKFLLQIYSILYVQQNF